MTLYAVTRHNVTPVAGEDLFTLVSASNRRVTLQMVEIDGLGTASSSGRYQIGRSTGGTTGGGAVTPEARETDAPAAATVANTTWAAQPTLNDIVARLGVNANGAMNRLGPIMARPGIMEARNGDEISIRCEAVPTGNINVTVWFEE